MSESARPFADRAVLATGWTGMELLAGVRRRTPVATAGRTQRQVRNDLSLLRARPARPGAPEGHLLVVTPSQPDPRRDSGSDRLVRLCRMAVGEGHPTVVASMRHRRWVPVEGGDPTDLDLPPDRSWGAAEFWGWMDRSDTVWCAWPEALARVAPLLGPYRHRRRLVYDTVDLFHVRVGRKAALSGSRWDAVEARWFRAAEAAGARTADVTVVVTADEEQVVRRMAPGARVVVVPNVHAERRQPSPPRERRSGVVFLGSYRHQPNVDAVRHLYDVVMPALWRRLPDVTLTVVGDNLPAELADAPDPRVRVLGWVPDLEPVLDGAVALAAPLRFGAGMKGKIGLAMANGLPVVTTPVGAEGMGVVDGRDALVAGDDASFAEACARVLTDGGLWSRLAEGGRELSRATLSSAALLPVLRQVLGD